LKKQLIIFGIIILLITVELCGCSENRDSRFVGTWKKQESIIQFTFLSDGTVPNFIFLTGNWQVKDNKLVITIFNNQVTRDIVYDYSFSNNDKTLTLTLIQPTGIGYDGTTGIYTKQ
jgi:hypothetical protein